MTEVHPPADSLRAAPDGVAAKEFEQLLGVGRQRGFLTQDDLMLAMDVVDTLRHDQRLVERELSLGYSDEALIQSALCDNLLSAAVDM